MSNHDCAGEAWKAACTFHDVEGAEVLRRVRARVEETLAARGAVPVVLFDLDSTLYDTGPRHRHIVQEWLAHAGDAVPAPVRAALAAYGKRADTYSLWDLFHRAGLDLEERDVLAAWEELRAFWRPRFFSDPYLPHDRPYPGAAGYVGELHGLGADVVYLTGRDEPGMHLGTKANLARDGFPVGVERTLLVMKPAREGDDLAHKVGVADIVRARGRLVASFENEPRNLVGIQRAFPDALHVFVDTVCSDHPAPVSAGLYRIRGYR